MNDSDLSLRNHRSMPHIYDLNPHLKPKPKEEAPEVKKGRPKKVKMSKPTMTSLKLR